MDGPRCDMGTGRMPVAASGVSHRWQAADFEQLEPERLDLREYAVQRGLVSQRPGQHGVAAARAGLQGGECGAHRLAQEAAHTDAVPVRQRLVARAGHLLTTQEVTRRPLAGPSPGRASSSLLIWRIFTASLGAGTVGSHRMIDVIPGGAAWGLVRHWRVTQLTRRRGSAGSCRGDSSGPAEPGPVRVPGSRPPRWRAITSFMCRPLTLAEGSLAHGYHDQPSEERSARRTLR